MKITVDINKNMFGKKKNYIALFGEFKEEGGTKEEAKQNLITGLEWYFQEYERSLTYKAIPSAGVTIILERSFYGYEIKTTYHDGSITMGSSFYGRISHREALKKLELHANNYIDASA